MCLTQKCGWGEAGKQRRAASFLFSTDDCSQAKLLSATNTMNSAPNAQAQDGTKNLQRPSQRPAQAQALLVPTFRDTKDKQAVSSKVVSKKQDPFLYFSDDVRRMAHLTGRNAYADSVQNGRPQASPVERKTRISFEVDPMLLLEDVFSEMDGMDWMDDDDILLGLLQ